MANPKITDLRATLAADLANTSVWQVFAYVPSTVIANSVIIQPDDPYITPTNNMAYSISPMARFKIVAVVAYRDNQGNLLELEQYASAIFSRLCSSGISMTIGAVTSPTVNGDNNLLMCEIPISILTSWG